LGSTTLAGESFTLLINDQVSETIFRFAWSVPASALVIPMAWD